MLHYAGNVFVGNSSEIKPLNVPDDARWYETDTLRIYLKVNGVWVLLLGLNGVSGYSGFSAFSGYSGKSGYSAYSGRSGYSAFSGYSAYSGYSGFSGEAGTGEIIVHQDNHGFALLDALRSNRIDNQYTKALADQDENADAVGIVSEIIDADNFKLLLLGDLIDPIVPHLTAGTVLFLSDITPGLLTETEPTAELHITKPIAIIIESGAKLTVLQMRGVEINYAFGQSGYSGYSGAPGLGEDAFHQTIILMNVL